MLAIRLHEHGDADQLRPEQLPDPEPGPGQVRIRVEAAGVHLVDTAIRAGTASPLPLPSLPAVLGRDVAGVVDAVAADVDNAWLGRRVAAYLGEAGGGYAELAVVAAERLHELPDELDAVVATAMVGTGRTALAVLDIAAVRGDDVVLVTAAAGGIGTLAVQAARRVGATVIGLAGGAEKTALIREAGAAAVDYTQPDWPELVREALAGREPSVALDGVGGQVTGSLLELLRIGGRLVVYGWASGVRPEFGFDALYPRGLTVSVGVGPRILGRPGALRGYEARALAEAAAGRLVPRVQTFPLASAAGAHRALSARGTTGKVVLVPEPTRRK